MGGFSGILCYEGFRKPPLTRCNEGENGLKRGYVKY